MIYLPVLGFSQKVRSTVDIDAIRVVQSCASEHDIKLASTSDKS